MRYPAPIRFVVDASQPVRYASADDFSRRVGEALSTLGIDADWRLQPLQTSRHGPGVKQQMLDWRRDQCEHGTILIGLNGSIHNLLWQHRVPHLTMQADPLPEDKAAFPLHLAAVLGRALLEGPRLNWRKPEMRLTVPSASDDLMADAEDFLQALGWSARRIRDTFSEGWEQAPRKVVKREYRPWGEIIEHDDAALRGVDAYELPDIVAGYGARLPWRRDLLTQTTLQGRSPPPHLVAADDRFVGYVNPRGEDHGPAHAHIFERDLGRGIAGARLALIEGVGKPSYSAPFPYYRQARGLDAVPGERVPKQTLKHNMNALTLAEARRFADARIESLLEAWRRIMRDTPVEQEIHRDALPDTSRIAEISWQGRLTERPELDVRPGRWHPLANGRSSVSGR